jgi:Flp pilus assembly protein TadG
VGKLIICILRRLAKNNKGVALIEFAIVTPFLLILLLGIVEFGWIFNGYITIKGAAREGARAASNIARFAENNSEIESQVDIVIEEHKLFVENIAAQVDYPVHVSKQGQKVYEGVKVTVSGDVRPPVRLFKFLGTDNADTVTFSSEATMRVR